MWMGEQQQLKKLDKKRNFSIILEKAKKFFTSLPFCFFGGKKVLLCLVLKGSSKMKLEGLGIHQLNKF